MHKTLTYLFFVSLVSFAFSAEPVKGNLAVTDLSVNGGVTADEARTISDRLEAEISHTDTYTVLERNRMTDILKEQGFQQSGACSATGCDVKVGQLLGVDKLVVGSLGKVGSVYSLNVKLLDVGTGKILRTQSIDVTGDLSVVLSQGCQAAVKGLLSKDGSSGSSSIGSSSTAWWIGGGVALLAAVGFGAYELTQSTSKSSSVTITRTVGN